MRREVEGIEKKKISFSSLGFKTLELSSSQKIEIIFYRVILILTVVLSIINL